MSREVHVRFWESAGVRFPRATHPADHARRFPPLFAGSAALYSRLKDHDPRIAINSLVDAGEALRSRRCRPWRLPRRRRARSARASRPRRARRAPGRRDPVHRAGRERRAQTGRRRARNRAWSRRRARCASPRRAPAPRRWRAETARASAPLSTKSAKRAPRDSASIAKAPDPANRSTTRAPSIWPGNRCSRMSKIDSRRRSEVGRMARDDGA